MPVSSSGVAPRAGSTSNHQVRCCNKSCVRYQPFELNYQLAKLQFSLAATLAGDAAWAQMLGPPAMLLDTVHHAQLTYNAMEHENEAQRLAFGGVLSTANLQRVQFNPDYDYSSGSFRSVQSNAPLTISGSWFSWNDLTTDRFAAASRYTFSGLETPSGHILTGYGITSLDRIERHDAGFNLLSTSGTQNLTETTRRYESYNDSFNGALANQSIQRAAEFNPHPNISVHVIPSPSVPYDQESLKRPPSIFPPPPGAPPPQPAVLSNDKPQEQAAGHTVPATHPASPPSSIASTPSSKIDRGGVKAEITIDKSDFAPPKKEEKK